ncbi:hypothetical protein Zmor_011145 [Zophobas morio]|uniref:PHD-type domain-containing protein n=1 Tax=Zophobas morio TaxID=2755281 RepID=A0AA38ISR1_9CUCU|nr:hypothetical protein Zmor_011145 [Zophobas morio]
MACAKVSLRQVGFASKWLAPSRPRQVGRARSAAPNSPIPMSVCLICNSDSNKSSTVLCDICHGPLHIKCAGLSENDVKWTRSKSKTVIVIYATSSG